MKKIMCFAVSMFMLVNLSFAATLTVRPTRTVTDLKFDKIEKRIINMKDMIELDPEELILKPIKVRFGEEEPIPVPAPIKPVLEIM